MSLLNLKADPLNTCKFTCRQIHNEAAAKVFKNLGKRLCFPDVRGIVTDAAHALFGLHGFAKSRLDYVSARQAVK